MATAPARRPQFRLLPPSPVTVRDRNARRVSAMRLGALAAFVELRLDEAELAGDAEAMCEECPAQHPDCALGCATRLLAWLQEGER